ncbi:hypothetical protein HMPREF9442_00133 [Paraprevotella xylaniphila YIT 11841]|uniref:Uncharacterized protein n=1 Tax=Paraprevotella xylaniphila YIT 11841 TaxID=762982 RepID=F3QPP6_9BACT|nr:hypothetical protein HMPREF9442_00133 [Paraprevotella xylaniphila YIT 11841]
MNLLRKEACGQEPPNFSPPYFFLLITLFLSDNSFSLHRHNI